MSGTMLDRATALLVAGDVDAALRMLLPAREETPDDAGIAARAADALQLAGRMDEALASYRTAVALGAEEAWYGLGCVLLARRAYGEAARALQRAVDLRPTDEARHNLGSALFELGQADQALALLREAARSPDPAIAASARRSVACIIPGADAADHAAVLAARREWARALPSPSPRRPPRPRGGKLRIGYMSAFFGARNWMKPVFGVINRHDRSRFEIHMFSDGEDPSEASGYRDCATDYVHAIRGLDHARVAAAIAGAGIDVLVDLNGYSLQDRLAAPAARPAPAVVGWFNMFATTGIDAFDWLVGDAAVIRPEEEAFYSERVHRVPGSYLAFEVGYETPPVAPPPCLASGRLTFGCLGSQYKLTDGTLAAWAEILRAAPGADLFVKNAALSDASAREHLLGRLAALGVGPERVRLDGRSEHFEFLRAYDQVDVALDTFPYNGGTTTSEALWQGVPVAAFDGDRWASRTSASLLRAAGLQDWVADDRDGYCVAAVRLALDPATPAMLAAMRTEMRARLRASAACDAAGLCSCLERFYETLAA
jgi:predicted O-linked N-acetylglucosamine transferase (SPINDLY family)